jgi:hypothetical protein
MGLALAGKAGKGWPGSGVRCKRMLIKFVVRTCTPGGGVHTLLRRLKEFIPAGRD